MNLLNFLLCVCGTFLTHCSLCSGFFDPISIAVGVGSLFKEQIVCNIKECCNEYGIPANITGLEKVLEERLYGQHLVQEIVINALRAHWDENHKPQKALTLSFHGWPGCGKNYVTKFLVDHLYKYGSKSKFVHQFIGRLHFPLIAKAQEYQQQIYDWIKTNVSSCPKQIFIFDEVDKMPPTVFNLIKPMIDYRDDVEGVDYRECIFIFLSNTGSELINELFLELWKSKGVQRNDLKLQDFEKLISLGAFNEEGGFHHSDTIKSNLIDHYVPFLPMEKRHVKLCILDEFKQRNILDPSDDVVNEAMEFIEWGPTDEKLFSKTGCKRISQKVATIATKYRLNRK